MPPNAGLLGHHPAVVRLPTVVSPLVRLGEREGVEVVLVTIEAWPDEVAVRMRGLPSSQTAELEATYFDALEAWHGEGAMGSAPVQPAEALLRFDVSISDDAGTIYAPRSAAHGGSGTMFRADYFFSPGPPAAAAVLTVRVGGANGVETRVELTHESEELG
jgi:hypothetical protein